MPVQKVQIVLPKNLVTAAKSRVRPAQTPERGVEIRDTPQFNLINTATRSYRDAASIITLIRHLAKAEGAFATAVHNMVEIAATKYKIFAYDNNTHEFSSDGTLVAMSVLSSMDTPSDYIGSTKKKTMDETIKTLLREAILSGMVCSELVLNKARLPDYFQIVGGETLIWLDDGKGGVTPAQNIAGEDDPVSLDIPSFFFSHLHPDPNTVSPRSMMEACLKMLVYFGEFMDEIRRSVRMAGHNRLMVELDSTRIKETAPREIQGDPKKLQNYMLEVKQAVEDALAQIDPEQALVFFDSAKPDVLNSGTGVKIDYTPLLNVIAGQYATAMKTPPSVLGLRLEGGSQQLGSVETLIYMKTVKSLHTPVETVMSRMLTLACRLLGSNVYIWFRMDPLDLRAETELEAFLMMRDQRLTERLSMGLISDDEYAVEMGCFPRPPGSKNLSGTMFKTKPAGVKTNPGDTPAGRDLQPDKDAPRKAGGKSQ